MNWEAILNSSQTYPLRTLLYLPVPLAKLVRKYADRPSFTLFSVNTETDSLDCAEITQEQGFTKQESDA